MLSVLLQVAFNKSHNWHTLNVVNVDCDATSITFLSQVRVFFTFIFASFSHYMFAMSIHKIHARTL